MRKLRDIFDIQQSSILNAGYTYGWSPQNLSHVYRQQRYALYSSDTVYNLRYCFLKQNATHFLILYPLDHIIFKLYFNKQCAEI
jgi:hypothetical protein